jgi:glutamate synthase (NADPH/NADH) small chain
MPGSAREVANAEEEGVAFRWLSAPTLILGSVEEVTGVRVAEMRLGEPDASGRRSPEQVPGGEADLKADLVIKALGFEPEDLRGAFGIETLAVSARGTLRVDPETFETHEPGVFAAGDIVRGASLVVWAIHDGLKAAAGIHAHLEGRALVAHPVRLGEQATRYDPRSHAPLA